jgi:hypothetical protein
LLINYFNLDDHLHLWFLELVDKKLYALKKVYKSKIPNNWEDKKPIKALGILIWCLVVSILMKEWFLP